MASTPEHADPLTDLLEDLDAGATGHDGSIDRALDGALEAMLDFGIRRTSVGEIARRGGVSPATLYRWFGSKDEIVSAVVIRETRRFLEKIETDIDRTAAPEDQMAEVSVMVARRLRSQPLLRRLLETEPDAVLPRLTVGGAPMIRAGAAYLARHLERLMNEGAVERFDPGPLAEVLARLTHSLMLTPETGLDLDDDERVRAQARTTYRWLLRLPVGASS